MMIKYYVTELPAAAQHLSVHQSCVSDALANCVTNQALIKVDPALMGHWLHAWLICCCNWHQLLIPTAGSHVQTEWTGGAKGSLL